MFLGEAKVAVGLEAHWFSRLSRVCESFQGRDCGFSWMFPAPAAELTGDEHSMNASLRGWCGGFQSQKGQVKVLTRPLVS